MGCGLDVIVVIWVALGVLRTWWGRCCVWWGRLFLLGVCYGVIKLLSHKSILYLTRLLYIYIIFIYLLATYFIIFSYLWFGLDLNIQHIIYSLYLVPHNPTHACITVVDFRSFCYYFACLWCCCLYFVLFVLVFCCLLLFWWW